MPDIINWNWEIGAGLDTGGKPFRDMRTPTLFGQPDHMKNFKVLPNTEGAIGAACTPTAASTTRRRTTF